MIETLVQYSRGVCVNFDIPLESVFAYNVRFQILTDTQEQKDYLTAMQMMFGREVDIRTWDEWHARPESPFMRVDGLAVSIEQLQPSLLPIYFCTSVQRHDR